MKLSIVIVNYNVKYFLLNCLHSVFKALDGVESEVFVVDNNSSDQSIEEVKNRFPTVKIIQNKENLGFSKANNQAIEKAEGEYVLLLNPDTVVEEDTFKECIRFMDQNEKIGGLGVKMIDGAGIYLPESKRGLPTPLVAFYKIFGFSRLFPNSKIFGKYHLGYIDKNDSAEIEILSGAYMFLRKSVLDKIGYLDESFFMYGEDIDLSWRIIKAGYKNYYLPSARIIHYKGESTKKSSVNYVFVFYRAMVIFTKKHFSKNYAQLFSIFINLAIYFRAFLAIIERIFKRLALPLVEFIILVAMMYFLQKWYAHSIKFGDGGSFPDEVIKFTLPMIAGIWILTNFIFGAYAQPHKLNRLLRSISAGMILILITYALLDESMRFSRMLILIFGISSLIVLPVFRKLMGYLGFISNDNRSTRKLAIVGDQSEVKRIDAILRDSGIPVNELFKIDPEENPKSYKEDYVGHIGQLKDLKEIYKINEIVFASLNVPFKRIIEYLDDSENSSEYKISPPFGDYIIGSNSNERSGEYYVVADYEFDLKAMQWRKRVLDILIGSLCLVFSPFLMVFFDKPLSFVANMWNVLTGKITLIGPKKDFGIKNITGIKSGIISPIEKLKVPADWSGSQTLKYYISKYSIWMDLEIMIRSFGSLDDPRRMNDNRE